MKGYTESLKKHLGQYAVEYLGIKERGTYKGRQYDHILPDHLKYYNLLEPFRPEIQDYLRAYPGIKLHQFFHHLNSSQAFALNFFFPYFNAGNPPARVLARSVGVDEEVKTWEFELVLDQEEGTNIDVAWKTGSGARVFCEVKLSENEFGQARNDLRHQEKLENIYTPRLRSLVSNDLLSRETFFRNYQILRNISLLAEREDDQLVFLLPGENESLTKRLGSLLERVKHGTRQRIHIAHVEKCIDELTVSSALSPGMRAYASELKAKYVI